MELLTVAGALLIVAVIAFSGGVLFGKHHATPVPVFEPSTELQEELADLRHLKAQFDNPPTRHEHIWSREPVVRKMGWLQYRCAYANCPEVRWKRKP